MEKSGMRAFRCCLGYLGFLLLLLLAVAALLALFGFLSGHPMTRLTSPVSASPDAAYTVILDAGHGGEDGGAVGQLDGREIYEKDINLSVTLLLRDLLEADGVNVVLTREEDVLLYDRNTDYKGRKKVLDLAARLAIGERTDNALFVSIHMNAFPQSQYRGLQVYHSPNNAHSQALAQSIQSRVSEQLQPDNHRRIKRAGSEIYLLYHLNCPAVLVECGFLSNPDECRALADQSYQKQLAFLLFTSIRESMEHGTASDVPDGAVALRASKYDFPTEIRAEALIFRKKYYIINHRISKTEDTLDERNENHLYLLGMRDEKPQVAWQMPRLRRMEFLC